MTRQCVTAVSPAAVEIRQIAENLYDVQIRENIAETVTRRRNRETNEMEERTAYRFDLYTDTVSADTRAAFISGCIHVRHSIDDEIALIHKASTDPENEEYISYQNLRSAVKAKAADFFSEEG